MAKSKTRYFLKLITPLGTGGYSDWKWPRVGEWTPRIKGKLVECVKGYHVITPNSLNYWAYTIETLPGVGYVHPKIYLCEVETAGAIGIDKFDSFGHSPMKIVVRRAKLVRELTGYYDLGDYSEKSIIAWLKTHNVTVIEN